MGCISCINSARWCLMSINHDLFCSSESISLRVHAAATRHMSTSVRQATTKRNTAYPDRAVFWDFYDKLTPAAFPRGMRFWCIDFKYGACKIWMLIYRFAYNTKRKVKLILHKFIRAFSDNFFLEIYFKLTLHNWLFCLTSPK